MALKKADVAISGDGGMRIDALKQGRITLRLIGTTGFYFNAMSAKAKATLLLGGGKKTTAEKKELKHDPESEYRGSVYRMQDGPTLLGFPAPGIKGAMATAALETPGVTKTSVNRLIFLPKPKVCIWGRPFLKMDVVRSADMAKTPDIRTRAFLPQWASEIEIAFTTPTLSSYSIVSLLANAGLIVGIGDFRQEKGRGNFGAFRVIGDGDQDDEWDEVSAQGRDIQQAAMDDPVMADDDTRELMEILQDARRKRAA